MVDYVNPGVNESAPDLTWTKHFADRVKTDASGFASSTEQSLFNAHQGRHLRRGRRSVSFGGTMISDATPARAP